MIGKDGNSEIQFMYRGKAEIHLGEAMMWLSKCFGRHCKTPQTKTFELNTFSEKGLMYPFPLQ